MSKSYQQEKPGARINIMLDVDTGGNKSKKELPMKLLMLGDFSNGQAVGDLGSRERLNINKHNFNQIIEALAPKVSLSVSNKMQVGEQNNAENLEVNLEFKEIADFKPEHIVEQVEPLKRLMAMRNLLQDLKSCVIDNQTFRKELEKILRNTTHTKQLLGELSEQSPLSS